MSCDEVLTARVFEATTTWWKSDLSWFKLVNASNYESTKQSMGARIPGYFDGDYNSFDQKRQALYVNEEFKRSEALIRDTVRSYLPDSAIDAWKICEIGANANGAVLLAWPRNVKEDYATLNVSWKPVQGTGVGPLRKTLIVLAGGTIVQGDTGADAFTKENFINETSILLKRNEKNSTIHVVLSGRVEAGASYSTTVLIEPVQTPAPPVLLTYPTVDVGQLSSAKMSVPPNLTRDRDVEVYVRYESLYETPGDPWHQMEVKVDDVQAWFKRSGTHIEGGPLNVMDYRFTRRVFLGQLLNIQAAVANYRTANKRLTIDAKEIN